MTSVKGRERPRVIFFDINGTLLDLTDLKNEVSVALGDRPDLAMLWFSAMLHYSLVATIAGEFKSFDEIGTSSLMMVARSNGLDLSEKRARKALEPMTYAPPHPDVPGALKRLKEEGFRMAALTNSFQISMKRQLDNAGLTGYFKDLFSAEEAGIYKPHRDIYPWAARRMGHWPNACMLVTAHGWDAAGALWNGMRAAFVSRPGKELYPLAPVPEIIEPDLDKIAGRLISLPH